MTSVYSVQQQGTAVVESQRRPNWRCRKSRNDRRPLRSGDADSSSAPTSRVVARTDDQQQNTLGMDGTPIPDIGKVLWRVHFNPSSGIINTLVIIARKEYSTYQARKGKNQTVSPLQCQFYFTNQCEWLHRRWERRWHSWRTKSKSRAK
jgi:hypothetical protein